MAAALVFGVLLTAITEILSVCHALTIVWLVAAWGLCALVLLTCFYRQPFPGASDKRGDTLPPYAPMVNHERATDSLYLAALAGIVGIILIVGFTALIAPPNTWDAMTYHMARVAHWAQNRSVAFYPASDQRQLYQHPWAEYALVQMQLLSGGDHFANMVQWCSMVGSIIGVSAVTQLWRVDWRGQVFAATFCAAIPMGILQGSGSQNDYVVAFWLINTAYGIGRFAQGDSSRKNLLWTAAGLGLTLLTKATAYIYTLPFILWFLVLTLRHYKQHAWKPALLVGLVSAAIIAPHLLRNMQLFRSPLGPLADDYTNHVFYPNTFASNVIRNVALHVVVPKQLGIRTASEAVIEKTHALLHVDINDPRITFPHQTFALPAWTMHEDLAPAPIHLALTGLAVLMYGMAYPRIQNNRPGITGYLLAVGGGFLLFCFILQWQPWHARLHLPFWVAIAPFVALVWERTASPRILSIVLSLLLIPAIYPLFLNANRPVLSQDSILKIDRMTLYFANMPGMQDTYETVTRRIHEQRCDQVGLAIVDEGEYPFWALLGQNVHIEHVNTPFLQTDFTPCAMIVLSALTGDTYLVGEMVYRRVWEGSRLALFLPSGTPPD